jgi:catechol 2,3-dioxygenase-like lactoylglutathione lyase family enzyme
LGLHYSGLRVTDLERALAFYTERMGLRERRRGQGPHGSLWVLLEDPRTRQRLELNRYPRSSPYARGFCRGETLDRIGFRVPDPAATVRRLVRAGTPTALLPNGRNGVRGVYYLKDPDGNWVEFF